jgi:hypothetical protein
MTIRTIAHSDRDRGHEQELVRCFQQAQQLLPAALTLLDRFSCGHPPAAVLKGVLPALASAHATTNTGQLAAKPALIGRTAARRRALERA